MSLWIWNPEVALNVVTYLNLQQYNYLQLQLPILDNPEILSQLLRELSLNKTSGFGLTFTSSGGHVAASHDATVHFITLFTRVEASERSAALVFNAI